MALTERDRSAGLGIPDLKTVLDMVNEKRFRDLPHGAVTTAIYGEPGSWFRPAQGEPGWHTDYQFALGGSHLGDFPNPMPRHEMARGSFEAWLAREREAHEIYGSLRDEQKNAVLDRLRRTPVRSLKQESARIATELGVAGVRPSEPTLNHRYSMVRNTNQNLELDKTAVRRAAEKMEELRKEVGRLLEDWAADPNTPPDETFTEWAEANRPDLLDFLNSLSKKETPT